MEKKEKWKLGIVYVFVFIIALITDLSGGKLENGKIPRNEVGGETTGVELFLNIDNVFENYEVSLEIEPRRITQEEANKYFLKAKEEIDADFKEIHKQILMKDSYVDEIVESEWHFSPIGMIGSDGMLQEDEIPEEGMIITASVLLSCGEYEELYTFPFRLEKPELTQKEQVEKELLDWIEKEQQSEGKEVFSLPKTLGGLQTQWIEKKEFLSLKILALEGISLVLLVYARKKEEENRIIKRREKTELQYPEVVSQLLILLEAGMTTRQAWHRIAYQYKEKQKKKLVEASEVYESIVQLDRLLCEGEKESTVYEGFAMQMDSMCYRRLVRLLVNNLEKGSRDICNQLSMESKQAYEQRILLAKKIGEEASTKMLIPMMLMMVLVMVIVMAPAVMGFSM